MGKKVEVTFTITPTSGIPQEKSATVDSTATVKEALAAMGIKETDRLNVFVDGKPVKTDSRVPKTGKVVVQERPAGS